MEEARQKWKPGRPLTMIFEWWESTEKEIETMNLKKLGSNFKLEEDNTPPPGKLFKICETGDNKPVCGLDNLPLGHAQLMMLVPMRADKTFDEMNVSEVVQCRVGTQGFKGDDKKDTAEYYDVVRIK